MERLADAERARDRAVRFARSCPMRRSGCCFPMPIRRRAGRALQRFVFRSKVTIEVRDDLHVSGSFAAPAHGARLRLGRLTTESRRSSWTSAATAAHARLRIAAGARSAAADAQALPRWHAFDLAHGLPRLPASQAEHWTPQQLSLERLQRLQREEGLLSRARKSSRARISSARPSAAWSGCAARGHPDWTRCSRPARRSAGSSARPATRRSRSCHWSSPKRP